MSTDSLPARIVLEVVFPLVIGKNHWFSHLQFLMLIKLEEHIWLRRGTRSGSHAGQAMCHFMQEQFVTVQLGASQPSSLYSHSRSKSLLPHIPPKYVLVVSINSRKTTGLRTYIQESGMSVSSWDMLGQHCPKFEMMINAVQKQFLWQNTFRKHSVKKKN